MLLAASLLAPFLLIVAAPGLRSFLVSTAIVALGGLWLVNATAQSDPVGPLFIGLAAVGWLLGTCWWAVRRVWLVERGPVHVAVSSVTGYAGGAALATLLAIPMWQPLAVALLR